jgi:hypothetical protein
MNVSETDDSWQSELLQQSGSRSGGSRLELSLCSALSARRTHIDVDEKDEESTEAYTLTPGKKRRTERESNSLCLDDSLLDSVLEQSDDDDRLRPRCGPAHDDLVRVTEGETSLQLEVTEPSLMLSPEVNTLITRVQEIVPLATRNWIRLRLAHSSLQSVVQHALVRDVISFFVLLASFLSLMYAPFRLSLALQLSLSLLPPSLPLSCRKPSRATIKLQPSRRARWPPIPLPAALRHSTPL